MFTEEDKGHGQYFVNVKGGMTTIWGQMHSIPSGKQQSLVSGEYHFEDHSRMLPFETYGIHCLLKE